LNPGNIFAPPQCEDHSLSNHTLRDIKIVCLIKLDEKGLEGNYSGMLVYYSNNLLEIPLDRLDRCLDSSLKSIIKNLFRKRKMH
jgi:hypothetical protein